MSGDPTLDSAIAVVGMAGRFPGAANVKQFWSNLRGGVESRVVLSDEELLRAGVPPQRLADPHLVKSGFTLDGFDRFDASFFGFSPKDAAIMDPQHRVFLETAWEALEDAGRPPDRFPGAIGVYAGCGMNGYFMFNLLTRPDLVDQVGLFLLRHTGNDKDFLATRVSYCLDLRGPSVGVQTACSSSLVAIHLACASLLGGECDMALAGGVTLEVPHGQGHLYQEGEILSPDGHCRAFDAKSAGTVFGSGAGVVVLRRLADALRDGDRIHAIIRGSAVNNDGAQKVGYLAPSVDGQAKVVAEALAVAGVDPGSVGYVEAHGTGTALGDPIEVAALTEAFRGGAAGASGSRCAIGSVKPNIGHLDTAAGVASFIKAASALSHRELPPSLFYEAPNPNIDFGAGPFFVNAELRPWEAKGPRRAGVTSLGVGGTNAHVVLEEAPPAKASGASRARQLLLLSARSPAAVARAGERLADHLREEGDVDPLADVAYTLAVGRRAFAHRRALVASSALEAAARLEAADPKTLVSGVALDKAPSVVFMFPGGGAQYPHVTAELYAEEPVFRAALAACFAHLGARGIALEPLLFPPAGVDKEEAARALARPLASVVAVFSTSYALARLWLSWGVKPAALTGHSLGEYVAACLAGVMSLEDALDVVIQRGRIFEKLPKGAMLSVPLSEEELRPHLEAAAPSALSLAVVNGPRLCVASGATAAIAALEARLVAADVECQRLHIDVAAHSPMLDPFLDEFREVFTRVTLRRPTLPFVSNRTGQFADPDEVSRPEHWVRHLRETVRFSDGLALLMAEPGRVFLEVGPGKTLAPLARQHPAKREDQTVVASVRHAHDSASDQEVALGALGQLWAAGVEVDFEGGLFAGQARRRVGLPTYPFERQRHWIEPGAARAAAASAATERTTRAPDERAADPADWFYRPVWRPAPLPTASAATPLPARVLVLSNGDALSAALAERLRARGAAVVEALPGAGFARAAPGRFVVRPGDADQIAALVRAFEESEGAAPAAFVHLWTLGAPGNGAHEAIDEVEARAFRSLFHLAKELGQRELAAPIPLLVAGRGFQQVAGEAVPHPERALALGPCRVIPRELPNVACRSVDLPPAAPGSWQESRLADALVAELAALAPGHADETVAYRGQERLVQRHEPLRLPTPAPEALPLRAGGVYLITGGFGGIGREVARALVTAARTRGEAITKLVLLGRVALPPREAWDDLCRRDPGSEAARRIAELRALEALGAEVLPLAVEVGDEIAVATALSEARARFGALHGVVHAAGVLDDGLIGFKELARAERVLRPKVRGTLALDAALGDTPLDFFLLFSSVSAFAGAPGQVDYAAANAFLDAFAHARLARTGGFTCAIDWSAWRETGMAAALVGPASGAVTRPTRHPFLAARRDEGGRAIYETPFDAKAHWLLDEHRLKSGEALVPGAGFVELARGAFEDFAGAAAVELREIFFLAPFVVGDSGPRTLQIALAGTTAGAELRVTSLADEGAPVEHVTGLVAPLSLPPPARRAIAELQARCALRDERFDGATPQAHLAFGPRWSCVRRISYGAHEALLALELGPAFAADLEAMRLHPALLDMATAGAQALLPGFDPARDFFVPVSYGALRLWAPLPARLFSHVRLTERAEAPAADGFASFDVSLLDEAGATLAEIEGFVMKRVDSGAAVTATRPAARRAPAAPAAPEAPPVSTAFRTVVERGMATAEGVDVFLRILGGGAAPEVVVSPFELDATVALFRATPAAAPTPAKPRAPTVDVSIDEIEGALRAHEAIADAAAVAKEDRPGELRIIAYVVYRDGATPTVSELRRHLRKRLPERLVPANVLELGALPKGPGGDVLRDQLPDPFAPADTFVAPRTEMERTIAGIYQEALGSERVGVHDNFFDIGGHSLLALRVVNKIAKVTGVRLNQPAIVLQTVEQIAAACAGPGAAAPRDGTSPAARAAEPQSIGSKLFSKVRSSLFGRAEDS